MSLSIFGCRVWWLIYLGYICIHEVLFIKAFTEWKILIHSLFSTKKQSNWVFLGWTTTAHHRVSGEAKTRAFFWMKRKHYQQFELVNQITFLEDGTVYCHLWRYNTSVIRLNVVLIQQNMPPFDLLVLVLETFIPVLQTFAFSCDTKLTSTCVEKTRENLKLIVHIKIKMSWKRIHP